MIAVFKNLADWCNAIVYAVKAIRNDYLYLFRKAALGDVLWIEPVVRHFAEEGRTVFVISDFPEVFDHYPFTNVHVFSRRCKSHKRAAKLLHQLGLKRYSVNLMNTYEKHPAMHFLFAYQQAAGLPKQETYPALYLSNDETISYQHLSPYAVIHLETASPDAYRQAHGINWQLVISHLEERNITPYFIAKSPLPYQLPYHHKLASVRDMIAFISKARLFIGIDSGPSHIAASLHIPCILFFGAINPWFRHFKSLFNGIIMQQFCEQAHCYHRLKKGKQEYICPIAGNAGIPKCSLFTNELLQANIDEILKS